jgi:Tfp pilus assembly protein PilF/dienelactone hydrolase
MRRRAAWATLALILPALVFQLACEKETHRAARRAFQDILARNLPPEQQAAALEELVRAYPEPKTNPNLVRAFGMLADYHARAGRPDIAASWYERAARVSPDDPDLLNALGYHYARNRMNLDRAVSVLETAVHLAEERRYAARRLGFIKDSLGWAYWMRGDLPLAVAILEEAGRLAPGVAVIQGHLAEAYRSIGERDRAAALYLDLYLKGRGTSRALRDTLRALGAEGGRAYAREVDRRIDAGLRDLVESDRRETEAAGATLVELRADDGQRLFGSLYRPRARPARGAAAAMAPTGGVLLLHPLGSSRSACAAAAAAIAAEGLWALAIDLRGHGASVSETLPDPHAFSVRLADNLDAAERDVRAGLVLLAQRPGVDASRLGLVGAGLGALLAARAASPDDTAPRPSVLVLLSPWGRADAYRDLLSRLSPDSLLLVAGSEEEAPLATVRTLAAPTASGALQSLVVEGPGSHFELAGASPGLTGTIAAFLRSRLAREARASGAGGRE